MKYLNKLCYIFILTFFLLTSTNIYSQWKIDKIAIGFENGIKKDFTTFTKNDGGYFLPPQHQWLGRKFLIGNYYYGGSLTLLLRNMFIFECNIFTFEEVNYDIVYIPELNKGSSGSGSSPYLRYGIGFGRDVKLLNRFYSNPLLQLSYVRTDNFLKGVSGGGGSNDEDYKYITENTYYVNDHFLLGIKNSFQWKFNKYLNLNFGFSYNHGLQRSSKIDHKLTINTAPESMHWGESVSRLSHSTFFLSAQYNIRHEK
jgi:hypothetical protein